jgi:hypothetical protein
MNTTEVEEHLKNYNWASMKIEKVLNGIAVKLS